MMDRLTINDLQPDACTGCMLCMDLCHTKAITKAVNAKGFLIPIIAPHLCVHCGVCFEKCPVNQELQPLQMDLPCYAAMADDDTRKNSSSGGAFSVFARYILKQGGVVIGAAFQNDFSVVHQAITNEDELGILQKSKYVQSETSGIYNLALKFVREGRKVLFVGTPCQVAAVRQAVPDNANLFCIDILCMGVSSGHCFDKYLMEEFNKETLKAIDFRQKKDGVWNQNLLLRVVDEKGERFIPNEESSYYTAFLKSMTLRPNCKQCMYFGKERQGDITIGDFWGVEKYDEKLDDKKGTSLLIVGTGKGKKLLEEVKNAFKLLEKVPLREGAKNNKSLCEEGIKRNPKADEIWNEYNQLSLRDNVNRVIDESSTCGIINYWWSYSQGAILTAFALQQLLLKLGYPSRLINVANDGYDRAGGISEKFERKYLCTTYDRYPSYKLSELKGKYKYFIVGSDQVFRAEWVPNEWFLSFVDERTYKIAIAASFGTDEINNVPKQRKRYIRYLLHRFNDISVREISGLSICKRLGLKRVNRILDPVFLIDKTIYEGLSNERQNSQKFIFAYILDENSVKIERIEKYAKSLNLNVIYGFEKIEVEQFLANIRFSEYVITDSFHGLCFSMIFHKPVICFKNELRGNARFDTLEQIFKIPKNAFLNEDEEILSNKFMTEYEEFEIILEHERAKSVDWIQSVLEHPTKVNRMETSFYAHRCTTISEKVIERMRRVKRKIQSIVVQLSRQKS